MLGYVGIVYSYIRRRRLLFIYLMRGRQLLREWAMLEIYLLGIVIAAIKLADNGTIMPASGAFLLAGAVLSLIAAERCLDDLSLWRGWHHEA